MDHDRPGPAPDTLNTDGEEQMDSITLALVAMLAGILLAGSYVGGYYAGRKDQTPGDRMTNQVIPAEAVEAAAKRLARYNGTGPGNWEWYANEARAILEVAAPFIRAEALEGAADELAQLPYVRPDHPDRAEYQRMIGIRRGNTDGWLRARAAEMRQG